MPSGILKTFEESKPWKAVQKQLSRPAEGFPLLGGITGSMLSLVVAGLLRSQDRPLLVIVPGDEAAEGLAEDLDLLGSGGEDALPSVAILPAGHERGGERAHVVAAMGEAARAPKVIAAPARALVESLPAKDAVQEARVELVVGAPFDQDAFVGRLSEAGFLRVATVLSQGSFAVRGDLIDFFPFDRERPIRLEIFDDEVEGLRGFDPQTQLSIDVLKQAAISLLTPETPLAGSVFADHLSDEWLVVMRDPMRISEALEAHLVRIDPSERPRLEQGFHRIREHDELLCSQLKAPSADAINFGGQVIAPGGTSFESAVETLERVSRGKTDGTLLCFDTEPEKNRFFQVVREQTDSVKEAGLVRKRRVRGIVGRLHQGFHTPFLGLAALCHHELFANTTKRRPKKQDIESVVSTAIDSFLDLDVGDYVVHLAHGIARFEGLQRVNKGDGEQDFLVLVFRDNVNLHVPASKIELVQKYIGGKGDAPELSKLGSSSWEKRKEAVAKAVTDMAADLLEHHAMRARKQGIQHPPDAPWQQEFEAAFPYQVTPDQGRAVEAIKEDMESLQPMDRLLCGDVGYGKTEVSMRAAFKCAMGGRQVAVLVPTTVLAQQHWESFRDRMKDYPVVIECLSRFRTKSEQKAALAGLADGSVDIVIGTHRLVQSDVEFKDLGLLIIDEEQRFGVAHKEKLRRLRINVDVLVLSATPIPRTLHQAILGIRDISPLGQAPKGRREVQTEVLPFDDGLVREAILREIDREGQVFFVHNRVGTIYKVAKRIQGLVPNARIAIGHGQMPERQLERTMVEVIEHEADVLVATTIIESGLDIPRVNTIFVDQAEMYGLSDLHQLRGRVGRGNHQAYAYFLVRPEAALSEIAEKRLRAIEEFSRLGSGFQIAMRDMEIRGAGNILGPEQSGHIASVGYDMYCRLLESAVKRLKNEPVAVQQEFEINLDFTAFLPEDYIADRRLRVEMYRKLGRATDEAHFDQLLVEMGDRFGPLPEIAKEFVVIARIRALMERVGVKRLEIMPDEGVALHAAKVQLVMSQAKGRSQEVRVLGGKILLLVHPAPFTGPGELFKFLESLFVAVSPPPELPRSG